MEQLLTREQFKEAVFKRDGLKCVVCGEPAVDAHHIIDRAQFPDGGYYLSNGSALCTEHHIDAEKSVLTCEEIRKMCGIETILLPPGFDYGKMYDKWGKEIDERSKYPRSLHAKISLGTTSDDRFMLTGYVRWFAEMREMILTEKLDGQNCFLSKNGVFARSHVAPSAHPWDKPIWDRWQLIKNDLGSLEIFGESMYAIHSIAYSKLESYFYVFAVRENGRWLSWEEVQFYAAMMDFPTVPQIPVTSKLSELQMFASGRNENDVLAEWLEKNLGMPWIDYVETPGALGGFDPKTGKQCCEGFVIRSADSFQTNRNLREAPHMPSILDVMPNEFDSLMKLVRQKHVKTDEHWTKTWKPATLIDSTKYKWWNYSYLK